MKIGAVLLLALAIPAVTRGQESASFRITESVMNSGGRPADGEAARSTSFALSLEALGTWTLATSAGPSFGITTGLAEVLRPPGEVGGLRFTDPQSLVWSAHPAAGTYSVFRGAVEATNDPSSGACRESDLTATQTVDVDLPATGSGFAYVVTVANRLGQTGTQGSWSDGTERQGSVCP